MNPDNSETITKDELIRRLRERAENAEKELDEERELACDRGLQITRGLYRENDLRKERDALAAQVVAITKSLKTYRKKFAGIISSNYVHCNECFKNRRQVTAKRAEDDLKLYIIDQVIDCLSGPTVPAAASLMWELEALKKLDEVCVVAIKELDEVTESDDGRYGHFINRATGEAITEAVEAVEAARGKE